MKASFFTGVVNQVGIPCYYWIHPKESFLFTLTKLVTGLTNQRILDTNLSSDYNCCSLHSPLDAQVPGYHRAPSLMCFVDDIPLFF